MNEEQYLKITAWLRRTKEREKWFCFIYYFLPAMVVIIYGTAVLDAIFFERQLLAELLVGPATVFAGVTLFRKKMDSVRPYARYNYRPMVFKSKTGESFPSRHTVSASAIAVSFLFQNKWLFFFMALLSILIALTRILAGVHFIRDVVWGAVIGYGCTFILTVVIHAC